MTSESEEGGGVRSEDDTNVTHARFQVTAMTAHCAAPESQNAQSRKRQEAERKKGANINHKLEAAAAAAAGMEATQNEAHTHSRPFCGSKNAE